MRAAQDWEGRKQETRGIKTILSVKRRFINTWNSSCKEEIFQIYYWSKTLHLCFVFVEIQETKSKLCSWLKRWQRLRLRSHKYSGQWTRWVNLWWALQSHKPAWPRLSVETRSRKRKETRRLERRNLSVPADDVQRLRRSAGLAPTARAEL